MPGFADSGVVALTAKLHRLPAAGVAVGAGGSLPGGIGDGEGILQSAFAVGHRPRHFGLHHCRRAVDAPPSLAKVYLDEILAWLHEVADVVFNIQRPFVKLRHGRLHHMVTHTRMVDVHLVVPQRHHMHVERGRMEVVMLHVVGREPECLAQYGCLDPPAIGAAADKLLCRSTYCA